MLDKGGQEGLKDWQAQGLEQGKGQEKEQEEREGLHAGGQRGGGVFGWKVSLLLPTVATAN